MKAIMTFYFIILASFLVPMYGCTPPEPPPPPPGLPPALGEGENYTGFDGRTEYLYKYSADSLVLRTPWPIENPTYLLTELESCLDLYKQYSHSGWPQKASIAVVFSTCGAGCGRTGIAEIAGWEFNYGYSKLGDINNLINWIVGMYEFGRGQNFPFYDALYLNRPRNPISIAFPYFVWGNCLVNSGYSRDQQQYSHLELGYYRHPTAFAYKQVMQDSNLTLFDTMSNDTVVGSAEAMAALFSDLQITYGENYMTEFFAALIPYPKASSVPEVIVNLRNAAIEAALETGNDEQTVANYLYNEWGL